MLHFDSKCDKQCVAMISIEDTLFGCLDNERFETLGDLNADFRNLIGWQEEAKCALITQLHGAGEWYIFNTICPVLGSARDNICKMNKNGGQ